MIKILNSSKELQAIIKDSYNPLRFEEINGENKLSFNAILTEKVSNYVTENNIVEIEDDYFDIAYYSKDMNEDDTCTMAVECEHISYRLNDPMYNMDYFTEMGTPHYILGKILQGTGFSIGSIDFTTTLTYSAQEKKSRRQLLMEFVALVGGEVVFNKHTISILKRRGNTDVQIFTKGKNIKVISKVYNNREDVPVTAYTCTPIILPNKDIGLGDDVLLIQPELGIQDTLRVVRHSYNPFDKFEAEIEIANYINGLEDQLYRIETSTVAKEKVYNGCRIGPDEGFVAERSDEKAKTIMNATEGISIYSDQGGGMERNFYVDLAGRIQGKGLDIYGDATFEGDISASLIHGSRFEGGSIDIGNGLFTVDEYGSMYAYDGTFEGDVSGAGSVNVDTDMTIGNYLYIGSRTSTGMSKGIEIEHGGNRTTMVADQYGDFDIMSWSGLNIGSYGNMNFSGHDINMSGFDMFIDTNTLTIDADTILPSYTWLGYESSDNRLATQGDINDLWYAIDNLP